MLNKITTLFLVIFAMQSMAEETPSTTPANPNESPSNVTEASQSERVGMLYKEQFDQMALAQAVKPNELVWLKVKYPNEEPPVNVLALEQKPRKADAHGAVLILHDKEQHADWPHFIRPLRMSLPDAGWDTLTVNLPYENAKKLPERSLEVKANDQLALTDQLTSALQKPAIRKDVEENSISTSQNNKAEELDDNVPNLNETQENEQQEASNTENVDIDLEDKDKAQKTILSYKERALLHVSSAIDYLRAEGYENIIIVGYRSGADLALEHIKPKVAQIPARGFALVMVDPVLQEAYQTDMASFFGKQFKAPVLDIFNGSQLENRKLAKERMTASRVAEVANYFQVSLNASQNGAFQQTLIRRIRYWLEKYMPGMAATRISPQR